MKHWFLRAAALAMVLLMAVTVFTACDDKDPVVIYDTNPTEETVETQPTTPIPEGRLSLSKLMGVMGPNMAWSELKDYDHTVEADEAVFTVQNNNGQTCTLTVVYDETADTISKATLSCGDVELDALSGETAVVRKILVAMNEQAQ